MSELSPIDTDNTDNTEASPESDSGQRRVNRRRMFVAGAGLAGAAALSKVGSVQATDGQPVLAGQDNTSTLTTSVTNGGTSTDRSNNALKGVVSNSGNNSHAVLGVTEGEGHAVAGVVNNTTANAVAATWGRQFGPAAAIEGENQASGVPIAGPANGVLGIITDATNGSHAVLGTTPGDGHAVAGVNAKLDNARAATWGRHLGLGPGVEGENKTPAAPLAGPAVGVLGSITEAANGSHAVKGVTKGAGHSVAGDTPADAKGVDGVGPNTTAATWGRHGGVGAGIGGISTAGYGGEFVGGKASVRLIPGADVPAGPPSDEAHLVGELYVDGNGDLFYNPKEGANFQKLNSGGITMMTDPKRAFDSRSGKAPTSPAMSTKGRFSAGETRSVDLTEFTDLPAGATGAILNVAAVATGAKGFLTLFNGDTADADRPLAATVNWVDTGDNIANGVIVPIGADGSVKVYALTTADVVIDVVGYIS